MPLRPPERLQLRLLARLDDDGAVGRVGVETSDVAGLQLEPRVAGDLDCLDLEGLQAAALQDAEHPRDGNPRPSPPISACGPFAGGCRKAGRPPSPRGTGPATARPSDSTCRWPSSSATERGRRRGGGSWSPQGRALRIEWGSVLILSRRSRPSSLKKFCVLLPLPFQSRYRRKTARHSPGVVESFPTGK